MQRKEYFNSRPHGGRLYRIQFNQLPESISTHALTEGDIPHLVLTLINEYFNSRPHGGRPVLFMLFSNPDISTHALTEGDRGPRFRRRSRNISTHALTEGDKIGKFECNPKEYFNSRPHGGRHVDNVVVSVDNTFQLTPSRRATANLDKFFF